MPEIDRVQSVIGVLQREFPQLDLSAKEIAARLVRLGTLFVAAIERVAATFGMSANEYVILCVLRASGRPYTLPPKAISPLMTLSSGGMTNILHGLAARGLIERLPDPSDRRGVLIRMTPEAVKRIDQAIAAHVAEEHRMIAALNSGERRALRKLLHGLLIAIDPVREPVAARSEIHSAPRRIVGRKTTSNARRSRAV
jgi:DNA-binding MarR family transcriptional regulator